MGFRICVFWSVKARVIKEYFFHMDGQGVNFIAFIHRIQQHESHLCLFSTTNDTAVGTTNERRWQLFDINVILTPPTEWIVLTGWVDNVKLDWAVNTDASAHELYDTSVWIKHWSPDWTREVEIMATATDVVWIWKFEVTVWHQATTAHNYHRLFTSLLQVRNATNHHDSTITGYCYRVLLFRSTLTLWRRATKVIAPFWFLLFWLCDVGHVVVKTL